MSRSRPVQNPLLVEPTDLLVGRVQLRGLVDVDLARLLGMGLAELLALVVVLQAGLEDPALAGEIRSAVQPQACRELELVGVEQMSVWVLAEVQGIALPVDLEAVGPVGQGAHWRAVVRDGVEVLVLAVWRDKPAARLRRRANSSRGLGRLGPGWTRSRRWLRHLGGAPGRGCMLDNIGFRNDCA